MSMFEVGECIKPCSSTGDLISEGTDRYEVASEVGAGGYGAIYKVVDKRAAPTQHGVTTFRAVKVLKQDHAKNEKVNRDFLEEIGFLSRIQNPHIVKILDWGYASVDGNDKTLPFYVMEWIDGFDLQKVLDARHLGLPLHFFVQLARQVLLALKACHSQDEPVVHLDIKPDNILVAGLDLNDAKTRGQWPVDADLHFMLTDFGKAKLLATATGTEDGAYDTAGGGIFKYVHPKLRPYLRKNKVPREVLQTIGRQCDIYSLGVVFQDVFKRIKESLDVGEKLAWEYLVDDMLWHDDLPNDPLKMLPEAGEALAIVEKLGAFKPVGDVVDLPKFRSEGLIRLQEQVSIQFPSYVRQIVDTPEFQRLRNITQLGLSSLIYPSATHTRFSHAVGSYYYASQYLESLGVHPIFQYLFSSQDILATQLAALLHDVGHYPYAHYFEEMGGVKVDVNHVRLTKRIISGHISYRSYLNSSLARKFLPAVVVEDLAALASSCGSLSEVLADVADPSLIVKIFEGEGEYRLLKSIIDGPLDCDKLDYLRRDGAATGVPYANAVDLSRFFSTLTIDTRESRKLELAVTAKGKSAVESIISARYNLFSEVYWHKTARAAVAMLKDAFWELQESISQVDFDLAAIGLGDRDFLLWMASCLSDGEKARDLILGSLCVSNSRKIYKRIKTYASVWEEEEKRTLHHRFTDELGKHYREVNKYRNLLIEEVNKSGAAKRGPNWKTLRDHHLLVDVPYVKHDQYGSVAIKYPPSVEGTVFYRLNAVSQLSKAVYDSFAEHTKKVRLFCHPGLVEQVRSLGKELDHSIEKAWGRFR